MTEQIKTCQNCAYRYGSMEIAPRCLSTGNYCDTERTYGTRCGFESKLWVQRPSMTRRFIDWLLNW